MRPSDPRIQQTLNQISHNLDAASQSAQASLFSFSQTYLNPCLSSFRTCLEASCQPCFSPRDERQHRQYRHPNRPARRGRESLAFDFYDDWEQEEAEWGNDELDRLLADSNEGQPGKRAGMSYGSRSGKRGMGLQGKDGDDLNVVPQSSMFGFLESLPWKIGGRGTRYKPNVANLQENVGRRGQEAEPLIEERRGRGRSGTTGSRSTTNSLSSRGDLFPSDDEDDAVPIDDEFAMQLGRRTTATSDENSSRKKGGKRPAGSRASTKTASSRDTRSMRGRRDTSGSSGRRSGLVETAEEEVVASLTDLKHEEARVQAEEEAQVERRRKAAWRLASERGLSDAEDEINVPANEQDSKEASIVDTSEVHPTAPEEQAPGEPITSIRPPPPLDLDFFEQPQGARSTSNPDPRPPDEST